LRKSGDPAGALAHAQKALALSQQLSAADPQNVEILSDVANCHLKLAQVLMDTRDFPAALGHAMKSMTMLDGLLARSKDSNLMRMRIRAALAAGGIELRMDRAAAALVHYGQAGKAAGEIVAGGAGQISARTDLARSQTGAADANERLHRWREALEGYRSAGQTWSALRDLKALAPEDANQPELAGYAAGIAVEIAIEDGVIGRRDRLRRGQRSVLSFRRRDGLGAGQGGTILRHRLASRQLENAGDLFRTAVAHGGAKAPAGHFQQGMLGPILVIGIECLKAHGLANRADGEAHAQKRIGGNLGVRRDFALEQLGS
jgi:tetratricopeptide (TPR) repeat protein